MTLLNLQLTTNDSKNKERILVTILLIDRGPAHVAGRVVVADHQYWEGGLGADVDCTPQPGGFGPD